MSIWRRRRAASPTLLWSSTMAGVAGVGFMYFLDPQGGPTRRARARQGIASKARRLRTALVRASCDAVHRARGLARDTAGAITEGHVNDEILEQRVRAEVGHVCSHPGAIEVACREGTVILTGDILTDEHRKVARRVRQTRGVRDVQDRLQLHEDAGRIPSLQDGEPRGRRRRAWSPARRCAAGAAGAALAVAGWRGRNPAIGIAGLLLGIRGLANAPLRRLVGLGAQEACFEIDKTIHVAAPPAEVFSFWQAMEQFPRFMTHVKEVRRIGEGRYRWTVEGPGTVPISWEADVTGLVPGELIAWRSRQGAPVHTSGVVRFDPARGGTRVHIRMRYHPPAGAVGHGLARLFGVDPRRQMDDDLLRFKSLLEQGKATGRETVTRAQITVQGG